MADTVTTNLALIKPEIGVAGVTPWAQKVNDNFDKIDTAVANAMPPAAIAFFSRVNAPAGWLKANGATVSRTAYPGLWNAIGTTYGAGDGSTTFVLPDLRGYFPRAVDDGRGIDSGRTVGSTQGSQNLSHSHYAANGQVLITGGSGANVGGGTFLGTTNTTNSDGGTEARPVNIALLACIKI